MQNAYSLTHTDYGCVLLHLNPKHKILVTLVRSLDHPYLLEQHPHLRINRNLQKTLEIKRAECWHFSYFCGQMAKPSTPLYKEKGVFFFCRVFWTIDILTPHWSTLNILEKKSVSINLCTLCRGLCPERRAHKITGSPPNLCLQDTRGVIWAKGLLIG